MLLALKYRIEKWPAVLALCTKDGELTNLHWAKKIRIQAYEMYGKMYEIPYSQACPYLSNKSVNMIYTKFTMFGRAIFPYISLFLNRIDHL